MPLTDHSSDKLYYEAAIYRLKGTCVRVQEDMEAHFNTAAVEAAEGIVTIFRWFAKRDVKNILLTELNAENTQTVLKRLGWDASFLKENNIEIQPYNDSNKHNPFSELIKALGLKNERQLISIGDTPQFLNFSWAAGIRINIGVTYGLSNYQQLSDAPHAGMLDRILELPSFIIENGVNQEVVKPADSNGSIKPLRLYLRLPFF